MIAVAIVADLLVLTVAVSPPASAADATPPTTPENLRVTAASPSEVDLAWNTSTDDVGVTAYVVLRDGQRLARVTAPKTTYDDTSVNANTTYAYRVRARDAAGNRSKVSRKVIASAANQVDRGGGRRRGLCARRPELPQRHRHLDRLSPARHLETVGQR